MDMLTPRTLNDTRPIWRSGVQIKFAIFSFRAASSPLDLRRSECHKHLREQREKNPFPANLEGASPSRSYLPNQPGRNDSWPRQTLSAFHFAPAMVSPKLRRRLRFKKTPADGQHCTKLLVARLFNGSRRHSDRLPKG